MSHSWRKTLKQLGYNSSQKITYQCADSFVRYQTGDHKLRHTYIINFHICTILSRSLAQTVSRKAEDLSRTQDIRLCGGQSDTRTGSRRIRSISPLGMIASVRRDHPSSVTETEKFQQFETSLNSTRLY